MLDEVGLRNLSESIYRIWIEPELNRRRESGQLPNNFQIYRCLVRLPKNAPPIVEFNEEVTFFAKAKVAKGIPFEKGEPVHLPQVEYFERVLHPAHDGMRVAFIFVFWDGFNWRLLFDFTPTSTVENSVSEEHDDWEGGPIIADYLNQVLREFTLHAHNGVKSKIESIALWAAPALLPYPLSKICEDCQHDRYDDARNLLISHCSPDFLSELVGSWNEAPFSERQKLFNEALTAHTSRQYTLSVSALLPQIEGVITDWIYSKLPVSDVPFRLESKTKKFRDLIETGAQRTFVDQGVAKSVASFILDGPVLGTFEKWLTPITHSFPNRHVVGHGKYVKDYYTEENSIKMFLMLDTLFRIIKSHLVPSANT